MGTASVTHQIVIKMATPAVNQAILFNPTGGSVKIKLNNSTNNQNFNLDFNIREF